MIRPHPTKLHLLTLSTLLLAGCGGGSDSAPDTFTQCNASGAHSSEAPSSYRLFPLLAEGVDIYSSPGSRIEVMGTDNAGNALRGFHAEYIDSRHFLYGGENDTLITENSPLATYSQWEGSAEHAIALEYHFMFNTSDTNAHFPFDDGDLQFYERSGDVFNNTTQNPNRTILANYFELIDSEAIPVMASPGDSGSLGTYMSGSDYTLERTWSLGNAKDDLAFLNIQSVLYRTADNATVYEESLSYQIDEEGARQCVALYANDRPSNFSVRLEGTLQETPSVN